MNKLENIKNVLEKIIKCATNDDDNEKKHIDADNLLLNLLTILSYGTEYFDLIEEIISVYDDIDKWYA